MHFACYHRQETVIGAVFASKLVFVDFISVLEIGDVIFKFFVCVLSLANVILFNEILHFSARFYFFKQINLICFLDRFEFTKAKV